MSGLEDIRQDAIVWLTQSAGPLWFDAGIEKKSGAPFNRLNEDAAPQEDFTRTRVICRQIYSILSCHRFMGRRPWQSVLNKLRAYLLEVCLNDNGTFCFMSWPDTGKKDQLEDNYDQAFVLFALAHLYSESRDKALQEMAISLVERLERSRGVRPYGFCEHDAAPVLKANPHMHFFEALLVWHGISNDRFWERRLTNMASLVHCQLLCRDHSVIYEEYEDGWLADKTLHPRVEPGHQFEWVSLLAEYEKRFEGPRFDLEALYDQAMRLGTKGPTLFIYSAISPEGQVLDSRSRLWTYTEFIKAALVMAQRYPEHKKRYEREAALGWQSLSRFLAHPLHGAWYDWLDPGGHVIEDPSPASSLYHLVGSIVALDAYCGGGPR